MTGDIFIALDFAENLMSTEITENQFYGRIGFDFFTMLF